MKETKSDPIEDFCWSVIFELRQPMTAISGRVQRAEQLLETDPRRARQEMDEVLHQIARIDELLVELYQRERRTTPTAIKRNAGPSARI